MHQWTQQGLYVHADTETSTLFLNDTPQQICHMSYLHIPLWQLSPIIPESHRCRPNLPISHTIQIKAHKIHLGGNFGYFMHLWDFISKSLLWRTSFSIKLTISWVLIFKVNWHLCILGIAGFHVTSSSSKIKSNQILLKSQFHQIEARPFKNLISSFCYRGRLSFQVWVSKCQLTLKWWRKRAFEKSTLNNFLGIWEILLVTHNERLWDSASIQETLR